MISLTAGSDSIDGAHEFYIKSKVHLSEAGFSLRKFTTNSAELLRRINENEQRLQQGSVSEPQCASQPSHGPESAECQVLGVKWDVGNDQLIFDVNGCQPGHEWNLANQEECC